MNLDDLLKNVREGLPVSPQDAARHKKKISTEKFFNLAQELRTEGTINGQQVTPAERKEGFKKSKNPIEFKKFVEKVSSIEHQIQNAEKRKDQLQQSKWNQDC